MSFAPTGTHLIAGNWIESAATFTSDPVEGPGHTVCVGTAAEVDQACRAAEKAFWSYGYSARSERAAFLHAIADEIEARGEAITEIGTRETGLPAARLQGERGRTTGQLRLFAEYILKGEYLDRRHDEALPDRAPLPRPDLKMIQRPIGPVAVFGASNFPLAFSTAGGDTAAALAAGCPVVVKGHPAHPGTGEIVAQAIAAALTSCGLPAGVFGFIQGNTTDVGAALVQHPLIRAVGFTGSLAGGRALFDLCAARPEPIPFFGELGSVNPMFLLPEAVAARGAEIGAAWAGSLTMGAGQFCTNPGIAVVLEGAEAFVEAAEGALRAVDSQPMLTGGIAASYAAGVARVAGAPGIAEIFAASSGERSARPNLYRVSGKDWIASHALQQEVFGPLGLVVVAASPDEMLDIARAIEGQLTCTLHMEDDDTALAQRLMPVLERKAGRILVNGFPTGVEVSDAMVHGGPYPASTNFGATSVGTMAIRRFVRPVCYQNLPDALLPSGA
ncbi:MAG: aldehyde dehydrogenase (NADP(+)) [Pseudomonadota bacterium]